MSRCKVATISSSISTPSKTAMLLAYVSRQLEADLFDVSAIDLRELPATALFQYPPIDRKLFDAFDSFEQADGVIIATPIYKASYSGLLKCFVDLLPQFACAGKVVLPLATGGSLAHALALDYTLRPVLQSMGCRQIVQSYFVPETDLQLEGQVVVLGNDSKLGLHEAVYHFKVSIHPPANDRLLGHPRPRRTQGLI